MFGRYFLRRWFRKALAKGEHKPLCFYERLWAGAPKIYTGPVGPAATVYPEAEAYSFVIDDPSISDDDLFDGLRHPDGMFAGYCFEILLARSSARLDHIPPEVFAREEHVSIGLTCLSSTQLLGEHIALRLAMR